MARYELDQLGFYQFEWLVQVLVKNEYGMSVEAWGGHSDHGRDAYSRTDVKSSSRDATYDGPIVFQAKFVTEANSAGAKPARLLLKACKQETERIKERRRVGKWMEINNYFLYTNAPIEVTTRNAINDVFTPVLGVEPTILGFDDICAELDLSPQIAKSFPQILTYRNLLAGIEDVFGKTVGDAVNADILKRTEGVIKRAQDVMSVFVPTEAFRKTWAVLSKHRFAVLSGPPEMGKTSISWMIALAQLANGWQIVDCENPDDFYRLHQSKKSQIFLADDAFGRTEYDPSIGRLWGRQIRNILPQLDSHHQLIWTSRRHILERARSEMDLGSTINFPMPAEIIVNADSLLPREKALILYRHAVAAGLEEESKRLLKSHVTQIVNDRHFTPLRIHLFCRAALPELAKQVSKGTLSDVAISEAIARSIREVTSEMTKTYKALPIETQWLLTVLLDEANVRRPEDIEKRYHAVSPVPLTRPIEDILEELDESFLRLQRIS
jgi:hypothetical protein